MRELLDLRMRDGSRQFGELRQTVLWHVVRDHVARLSGATLTAFICDEVTEAWIDFTYEEHTFSINDQMGEYWFFVDDPQCPDAALHRVMAHFERLLNAHP
jgi:uncharacterized protein (DUF1778 family)